MGQILGPLKSTLFPLIHSYLVGKTIDVNNSNNNNNNNNGSYEIKQEVIELQSIVDSASNLSNLWEYIYLFIL